MNLVLNWTAQSFTHSIGLETRRPVVTIVAELCDVTLSILASFPTARSAICPLSVSVATGAAVARQLKPACPLRLTGRPRATIPMHGAKTKSQVRSRCMCRNLSRCRAGKARSTLWPKGVHKGVHTPAAATCTPALEGLTEQPNPCKHSAKERDFVVPAAGFEPATP
jgi:hypothetical protein